MSIHVALEHSTRYIFDRPVTLSPHVIRLRPAPHSRTPILAYSLKVTPEDHFINWQQDPFGNFAARLVFHEKATELSIRVDLIADMTVINAFDWFVEDAAETYPFPYESMLAGDLAPYLELAPAGKLLEEWLADVKVPEGGIRTVDFLVEINQRLSRDIAYTTRMEPGVQAPEETLRKALGSCRDTGWLLVQILRRLGLAARFVSGYLVQLRSDEKSLDGPSGPETDFTDLHAWCEVFLPGAGWIGMDPTSGLFAGEGHIPLACTPSPASAAPVEGAISPAEVSFEYANVVTRLHEDPRVTLPYSEDQWERINVLGRDVDRRLTEGDVRLTQGGEPTFVSIDDMDGAEWTIAADGEDKRAKAWSLTKRLAKRFATGPMLHCGQGKWYPGEPLPRWQLGIHWRRDGEPLWSRRDLLADPWAPGDATLADAESLALDLAMRLGFTEEHCIPGYEDPLAELLAEARLPAGDPPSDIDPTDEALTDTETRAELVATIDARAGRPVGWALPLHRRHGAGGGWATSAWTFRRGAMMLLPGDSPMGMRLPLTGLAWTSPPREPDRSPFEPRPGLPFGAPMAITAAPAAAAVVPVSDAPPTALCVERRSGRLHVFMPPITHFEHAVELIGIIESAAADLGLPVVLEGYPPPRDDAHRQLVVTPDPGVIEVNVHPSESWEELSDIGHTIYAEARQCRLGAEKFELDGTHSGTGGGNHMTLGGPSAADSPLLRRPDLLRSMVTYWQHHPSLSYLFSGRFIGPTSQSPRIDEARNDVLDELEIAFGELDRLCGPDAREASPPPWLVDRLFRNLLTDLTGNTHRAEFCIDKMFTPEVERGRLGLLELRGFEMPPHPKMALVQSLLVRALVARFWEDPFRAKPVRWGNELHDRFLLPHEVAADIEWVVEDLRLHGIEFEQAWLAPFLEFRFPRLGTISVAGVTVELRAAIEPWLVLGEEVTATATARYVDSSVERLQVRTEGLAPERHIVTCNGIGVPLRSTDVPGVRVAGVRYRAWQPPTALHPTIAVHTPLVFDVVDVVNGRSIGGCTYHVTHPGGLFYDHFPVNANEADSRRVNRFVSHGHTPGPFDAAALDDFGATADRYPRTLDLRRPRP